MDPAMSSPRLRVRQFILSILYILSKKQSQPIYPVRGQGHSCRCWFSRNSHGVQQAIRFGKRVPALILVALPNHEDPHIHSYPGEL